MVTVTAGEVPLFATTAPAWITGPSDSSPTASPVGPTIVTVHVTVSPAWNVLLEGHFTVQLAVEITSCSTWMSCGLVPPTSSDAYLTVIVRFALFVGALIVATNEPVTTGNVGETATATSVAALPTTAWVPMDTKRASVAAVVPVACDPIDDGFPHRSLPVMWHSTSALPGTSSGHTNALAAALTTSSWTLICGADMAASVPTAELAELPSSYFADTLYVPAWVSALPLITTATSLPYSPPTTLRIHVYVRVSAFVSSTKDPSVGANFLLRAMLRRLLSRMLALSPATF